MKPNTYPKFWSTSDTVISVPENNNSDDLTEDDDDDD
jgi:hypothetical protein